MRCERGTRGPYETLVLSDAEGGTLLEVAPGRGGMVTRLRLRGREVLYLDQETLLDEKKNVRGGIPVLFPNPGKPPDGRLPQHGFARRMPWRVVEARERIVLALESSPATREQFPYDFELRVRYALPGEILAVEATVENRGATPLPVHLGFHPYLSIPDAQKRSARIEATATRALDNVTGERQAYAPPDLTAKEVDLHILDPFGGSVRLRADGGPSYRLHLGGFGVAVVWTLAGKDFVCLEPWSAPGGALATGEGLTRLPAHASDHRSFFLGVEP